MARRDVMTEIVTERLGTVLVCRLARPNRLNPLTGRMLGEFIEVLEDARTDDGVRVVVTVGEGDAWCAGADLAELTDPASNRDLNRLLHDDRGSGRPLSLADRVFDRLGAGREVLMIRDFDKPLIAAVNGAAAGGGFALAMLHDIRILSDRARFTTAFAKIGLAVEMGLSYTLPRAIGLEAATDLLLTGRLVDADEAVRMGLALRVVPHDSLMPEALAYAGLLASRAPIAVQFAKRALVRSWDHTLAAQLELEWPYQVAAFATDDAQEGISAFLAKHPPRFEGR